MIPLPNYNLLKYEYHQIFHGKLNTMNCDNLYYYYFRIFDKYSGYPEYKEELLKWFQCYNRQQLTDIGLHLNTMARNGHILFEITTIYGNYLFSKRIPNEPT